MSYQKSVSAGKLSTIKPAAASVRSDQLRRAVGRLSTTWQGLPAYGTRTFVPFALIWFSPLQIGAALLIATLVWFPVRGTILNLRVAVLLTVLNNSLVCGMANLMVATGFFLAGAFVDGTIALLWPFIANTIAHACPPTQTKKIEEKLWGRLQGLPAGIGPALSDSAAGLLSREQSPTT